jgi:dTDP-4-amino-4,6-dideoxygalactose transaminase
MSQGQPSAIPMVDLTAQYPLIREAIERGLQGALDEAKFILGPNVQAFEAEVAEYLGASHAIGVASGTDALHLALLAAGVRAGDEVITTPFSFISTAEAIRYIDAIPVFADIDPHTFNLDPQSVASVITPSTRAILPVHLFGQPANMPALQALANDHALALVEDCAQSFGAHVDGTKTGVMGITGAFSFFPSKNLGGYGDGGMVSTNDRIGYNSRLDELQAVILREKLAHIDGFNQARRALAHRYTQALSTVPGITPPHEDGIGEHVYHQYTLLAEDERHRDALMRHLAAQQIASAVYYPVPLHQQEAFQTKPGEAPRSKGPASLPVAESVAKRCFSLPMYPELSEPDAERVINAIQSLD